MRRVSLRTMTPASGTERREFDLELRLPRVAAAYNGTYRIEQLIEVVQRVAHERNQARIGRAEEVLVEGPSRTDPALLRGRTRRNTTVNFAGTAAPGDLVHVQIDAATSTTLKGTQLAAVAAPEDDASRQAARPWDSGLCRG